MDNAQYFFVLTVIFLSIIVGLFAITIDIINVIFKIVKWTFKKIKR